MCYNTYIKWRETLTKPERENKKCLFYLYFCILQFRFWLFLAWFGFFVGFFPLSVSPQSALSSSCSRGSWHSQFGLFSCFWALSSRAVSNGNKNEILDYLSGGLSSAIVVVWSDYYIHLTFHRIFAILHNVKREREFKRVPKKIKKLQKNSWHSPKSVIYLLQKLRERLLK